MKRISMKIMSNLKEILIIKTTITNYKANSELKNKKRVFVVIHMIAFFF